MSKKKNKHTSKKHTTKTAHQHLLKGRLEVTRSGMGYVGCANMEELRTLPRFVRITGGGLRESHPHTVTITREAPNYSL